MTTSLLGRVVDFYHGILEKGDPYISNYPMMDSPLPLFAILAIYMYVVCRGPTWMEPHKPWNLRTTLMIYNYILTLVSSTISIATLVGLYIAWDTSFLCYGMGHYIYSEDSGEKRYYMTVGWAFALTKVIELLDTIFFILRKKNNQISFLHVYHHVTATLLCWLGLKFLPAESNVLYPMLNSFIHAVMYTYYGLSAIGPEARKFLWWKKYITIMQIVQLSTFLVHIVLSVLFGCPCAKLFTAIVCLFIFTNMLLFVHFYAKTYGLKTQVSHSKTEIMTDTDSNTLGITNCDTYTDQIGNGEANRGEIKNDDIIIRETTKGDNSTGELKNGDAKMGEVMNGDVSKGELRNGDANRDEIKNVDTIIRERTKGDTNKGDITKGDTNKGETRRGDNNRDEIKNVNTIRREVKKGDTNKGGTRKSDANRGEITNVDTIRREIAKCDTNKGEARNDDDSKVEITNGNKLENDSIERKKDI